MTATRWQREDRPGQEAAGPGLTAGCAIVLAAVAGLLLPTGCATTGAKGPPTLGHIRLVPAGAPEVASQPFTGDSTIRRQRVVAANGACALYELEAVAADTAELPRSVLGHRTARSALTPARRTSTWEGTPVDGEVNVERAMVYAPEPDEARAVDVPGGVRVAIVFSGAGPELSNQTPWLLECRVPASGHVGIPASLVAGAFASGRRPTACSHEACSVSELELAPAAGGGGDGVERALLHAIHVEILAHADADAVVASRRSSSRARVALLLDEAPPELMRDERTRRATWEGTRTTLRQTLTSVP